MRTFILFLFGVAAIGLYFLVQSPEVRKWPNLSNLLGANGTSDETGPGKPVKTVRVDRRKLVGVWQSEDRREVLMLREDGKSRRALAYKLKGVEAGNDFLSATVSGVLLGDWNVGKDSLELTNEEFKSFKVSNPKFDMSNVKVVSSRKFEFNAEMKKMVDDMMKKEFEILSAKGNSPSPVTAQSEARLVLLRDGRSIPYQKVQIAQARDPNGDGTEVMNSTYVLSLEVDWRECSMRRSQARAEMAHY